MPSITLCVALVWLSKKLRVWKEFGTDRVGEGVLGGGEGGGGGGGDPHGGGAESGEPNCVV